MLNEDPVPSEDPPVATANQLMVPPVDVAFKVTDPGSQREPPVVELIIGDIVTVATTGVLAEVHKAVEASA